MSETSFLVQSCRVTPSAFDDAAAVVVEAGVSPAGGSSLGSTATARDCFDDEEMDREAIVYGVKATAADGGGAAMTARRAMTDRVKALVDDVLALSDAICVKYGRSECSQLTKGDDGMRQSRFDQCQ